MKTRQEIEDRITLFMTNIRKGLSYDANVVLLTNDIESAIKSTIVLPDESKYLRVFHDWYRENHGAASLTMQYIQEYLNIELKDVSQLSEGKEEPKALTDGMIEQFVEKKWEENKSIGEIVKGAIIWARDYRVEAPKEEKETKMECPKCKKMVWEINLVTKKCENCDKKIN